MPEESEKLYYELLLSQNITSKNDRHAVVRQGVASHRNACFIPASSGLAAAGSTWRSFVIPVVEFVMYSGPGAGMEAGPLGKPSDQQSPDAHD